jgi:hypothetical protein
MSEFRCGVDEEDGRAWDQTALGRPTEPPSYAAGCVYCQARLGEMHGKACPRMAEPAPKGDDR